MDVLYALGVLEFGTALLNDRGGIGNMEGTTRFAVDALRGRCYGNWRVYYHWSFVCVLSLAML